LFQVLRVWNYRINKIKNELKQEARKIIDLQGGPKLHNSSYSDITDTLLKQVSHHFKFSKQNYNLNLVAKFDKKSKHL
jgi:hypothetical protein